MEHPKPHTIRLKGKAYQALRKQVFELHGGRCSVCGRFAPLYDHSGSGRRYGDTK